MKKNNYSFRDFAELATLHTIRNFEAHNESEYNDFMTAHEVISNGIVKSFARRNEVKETTVKNLLSKANKSRSWSIETICLEFAARMAFRVMYCEENHIENSIEDFEMMLWSSFTEAIENNTVADVNDEKKFGYDSCKESVNHLIFALHYNKAICLGIKQFFNDYFHYYVEVLKEIDRQYFSTEGKDTIEFHIVDYNEIELVKKPIIELETYFGDFFDKSLEQTEDAINDMLTEIEALQNLKKDLEEKNKADDKKDDIKNIKAGDVFLEYKKLGVGLEDISEKMFNDNKHIVAKVINIKNDKQLITIVIDTDGNVFCADDVFVIDEAPKCRGHYIRN